MTKTVHQIAEGDTLYTLWSEWDIGHEGLVFISEASAKATAKELYEQAFEGTEDADSFEDLWEDLLGAEPVTFEG